MSNIEESDFLWKRLPQGVETNVIFKSFNNRRVFIMTREFEGDMYDCRNMVSSSWATYYFDDCYQITEIALMKITECSPLIDDKMGSIERDKSILPFKYNILQNETRKHDQPLYPF